VPNNLAIPKAASTRSVRQTGAISDYHTVRERNLRVMDQTAIAHCMEHNMPILVFNYHTEGNLERAVRGERIGTIIGPKAAQ
jgi:uridylate kinase